MRLFLRACLLAAMLAAPSLALAADHASQKDQSFLSYAAQDNQGEIQICLVAEKQARDPAVKAFARLMVNDHVQVESELAAVINSGGVSVPNDVGQEAQKTLKRLEPLHGTDFDHGFIAAQIEDHNHDIERFGDEQKSAHDEAVKRFAALTLPVLQQHLELAKAVQAHLQTQ